MIGKKYVFVTTLQSMIFRSQDGVVKAWNLERRRVCAEFDAHAHGAGVQRLDRLGRDRVVR